ncbi:MAG: uroporphyrinogen decarboxylase family protein [Armatimonadota bacterium]
MNARERFLETFRFGSPDRPFMVPQWVFPDTIKRWQSEGMPADVHFNEYFGFDRYEQIPINLGLIPAIEEDTVDETKEYRVVEDEFGGRRKVWKYKGIGMPQWLSYPLRNRDTWERFKQRLNPLSPCRYPLYWDDLKRYWKGRDYPLGIHGGSYYGWLRNWMGMENLAVLYYDDPDLVAEMTNYVGEFVLATIRRAVEEVELDYAVYWEDMAMKTGSLISPALFRRYMSENYRRVNSFLRAYGIDIHLVDCDGNVDELIPLWLEVGVNGVYPLEIAAGCDPLAYRERYGRELIMFGGIDKRALRTDRKTVEEEVASKVPALTKAGGWAPFVDHSVPPDVPLDNFQHYLDLCHEIFKATC